MWFPNSGSPWRLAQRGALLLTLAAGCESKPEQVRIPGMEATGAMSPPGPEYEATEVLHRQLAERNPEYDRERTAFRFEEQVLTRVELVRANLKDLTPLAGNPIYILDLRENDLLQDLGPLRGLPLHELYLEETAVQDLAPLAGLPLQSLYLSQTPVADLSPLARCPLAYLNLVGTQVTDLSPLTGLKLDSLWLNETPVRDITPLASVPLVSLSLHKTSVDDLASLSRMPSLQRLHVGETAVSDLRPLKNLRLQRLIFSPGRITEGLDVIRGMESLRELDVELGSGPRLTPAEFWARYDAGGFPPAN